MPPDWLDIEAWIHTHRMRANRGGLLSIYYYYMCLWILARKKLNLPMHLKNSSRSVR